MIRNEKIDFIRGIAIILVVVGHCIQNGGNHFFITNNLFFENILFRIIYSFHLPLFALLSGYLLFSSLEKRNTFQSLKHTAKAYLIPLIFWTIILRTSFVISGKNSLSTELNTFFYNFFTNYWFLWAIFFNNIIIILIKKISKSFFDNNIYKEIILFFCFLSILTILPDYWWQNHKFLLPFEYCGYLYNRFSTSKKFHTNMQKLYTNKYTLLVAFILYFVLLLNFHKVNYIYISGISIYNAYKYNIGIQNQIYYNLFRFILGLLGSILCIMVINLLWKAINKIPIIIKSIIQAGRQTIFLYCGSGLIQGIILSFFIKLFHSYSNNTNGYIDYKVIFSSSIMLIFLFTVTGIILDKSKVLRFLLKGKN